MSNRQVIATALVLLAAATTAAAQQGAQTPALLSPAWQQYWSVGFRSTSTTGDEARYQRFRDLTTGASSQVRLAKDSDVWGVNLSVENAGYNDQAYRAAYNRYGRFKLELSFDGQPLNYAENTLTPYQYAGNNTWTLDAATRTNVQNGTVVGIGTSAATDVATAYRPLASLFPMAVQRNRLNLSASYRLNGFTSVDFRYGRMTRTGNQPWGASFAFSDAVNIPMELDDAVNELTAGIEMARPAWGMVRAEYHGSFFKNSFSSLTWDNPLRATDYSDGQAIAVVPPTTSGGDWTLNGPWDNSGYSNGRGAATGRLSTAPSSQMNALRFSGLYKLPNRTTLNGAFSVTSMTQDEALLPLTTNAVIASPATYAVIPGLAAPSRRTAQADVLGLNAIINFATRPTDFLGFDMRYRFNDRNNRTPWYDYSYNVRFDAVPEYLPGLGSHQYDVRQNSVETGVTITMPRRFESVRIAYIMDDSKRANRAYASLTDYTLRASLDGLQNRWISVRGLVERTARIGGGLSIEHIEEGGGQEALRYYDDTDLRRTKASVTLGLTPSSLFDANVSVSTMNDDYGDEAQEFGFLSSKFSSLVLSANLYPSDRVTLGASGGIDKYSSHQASRNANPFSPTAAYNSWTDPNRNWFLDNDEDVITGGAWIDIVKALPRTDLRLALNYSDSDQPFTLFGPRVEQMKAPDNTALRTTGDTRACATGVTSCFLPLPNVTNTWTQLKVDVTHMFRPAVGLGVGYQYENFEIADFATTSLSDGSPRMDPLGAITTGYGNRPYTGSTLVARLIYTF